MTADQLILTVALTRRIRLASALAGRNPESWLADAIADRARFEEADRARVRELESRYGAPSSHGGRSR